MVEKYRPSNSTEGEMFEAKFCDRCEHDRVTRETGDYSKGCPILATTLLLDTSDPLYPVEWVWERGNPVCKAFKRKE